MSKLMNKIKASKKEEIANLNVNIPRKFKEWLLIIGEGSGAKGSRVFLEAYEKELEEAAKDVMRGRKIK